MKKMMLSAMAAGLFLCSCQKQGLVEEKIPIADAMLNDDTKLSARSGIKVVPYMAEYITSGETDELGQTIYFNNRGSKKLSADFVGGDPRRGGHTNITYAIDNEFTTDNGLTPAQITDAIDAAMNTWDAQTCSDLNITKVETDANLGWYTSAYGFGGSNTWVADIQHSGWIQRGFFDLLAENGSASILAVTFTLIFVDENDNPTDINNDKKIDVAFREIFYNDRFRWSIDPATGVDIETIALHETGHGLSQAHFGKAFSTDNNGKLHFAPLASMNAAYTGELRILQGSDVSGHCANWGSWPNK